MAGLCVYTKRTDDDDDDNMKNENGDDKRNTGDTDSDNGDDNNIQPNDERLWALGDTASKWQMSRMSK